MARGQYLIVGTGRSGCSRVAKILEDRFGIDFGGPGERNGHYPDGLYERPAQRVIDTAHIMGDITVRQWAEGMRNFANTLTEPYGLKHPLGAPFIQLYICLFPDAEIIWCQRDLTETVRDYYGTHDIDDVTALRAVLSRFDALARTLSVVPHVAVDVSVIETDSEIVDHLAKGLGIEPLVPA
jgi:hypothetical protein